MMNQNSRIVVFGAGGLIGRKLVEKLRLLGYVHVAGCTHQQLDLSNQADVHEYFHIHKPEYLFFCAVKGITDFEKQRADAQNIYSNLMMQCNVMQEAFCHNVKRAVFLGSAMLYTWNMEHQEERLKEEWLEEFRIMEFRPSMQAIVLSKYVGMKMCQYYYQQYGCEYIYTLPTHIYGPLQNRKNLYFLEHLVMSICDAQQQNLSEIKLDVYGAGKAQKQFLHVDDCADALIQVMQYYTDINSPINITTDAFESWSSIIQKICKITGYTGKIVFNEEHEENLANRLCSTEKLSALGWKPLISMEEGIAALCQEYMQMRKGGGKS